MYMHGPKGAQRKRIYDYPKRYFRLGSLGTDFEIMLQGVYGGGRSRGVLWSDKPINKYRS